MILMLYHDPKEFSYNEELSAQYLLSLAEDDRTALLAHFHPDTNVDNDDENASLDTNDFACFAYEDGKKMGKLSFSRCDSVGGSAMALLHLSDEVKHIEQSPKYDRRRSMKLAKFARITLCAAASDFLHSTHSIRSSSSPKKSQPLSSEELPFYSIMKSDAFSNILSFLNEGELIHSASLVCTAWADAAAESLGTLMLVSVGCDPSFMSKATNEDPSDDGNEHDSIDMEAMSLKSSARAKSMEKDWSYLMDCFPWAHFLSDGAFKRVYRVWNDHCGTYEALSVM